MLCLGSIFLGSKFVFLTKLLASWPMSLAVLKFYERDGYYLFYSGRLRHTEVVLVLLYRYVPTYFK